MSELDWLDDTEERGLEHTTMTNREKTINNISALSDDDFTKLFCEMSDCSSCPGKPLGAECHQRLMEWLNRRADND